MSKVLKEPRAEGVVRATELTRRRGCHYVSSNFVPAHSCGLDALPQPGRAESIWKSGTSLLLPKLVTLRAHLKCLTIVYTHPQRRKKNKNEHRLGSLFFFHGVKMLAFLKKQHEDCVLRNSEDTPFLSNSPYFTLQEK